MRRPDLVTEGWALEDGEQYHRNAPGTFWIPDLAVRRSLYPGSFAKLIFRIAIDDDDASEAVERMWVIVREITPDGYLGLLDNEPTAIAANDSLWVGTELPFAARHVIDVQHASDESMAAIAQPSPIPWTP